MDSEPLVASCQPAGRGGQRVGAGLAGDLAAGEAGDACLGGQRVGGAVERAARVGPEGQGDRVGRCRDDIATQVLDAHGRLRGPSCTVDTAAGLGGEPQLGGAADSDREGGARGGGQPGRRCTEGVAPHLPGDLAVGKSSHTSRGGEGVVGAPERRPRARLRVDAQGDVGRAGADEVARDVLDAHRGLNGPRRSIAATTRLGREDDLTCRAGGDGEVVARPAGQQGRSGAQRVSAGRTGDLTAGERRHAAGSGDGACGYSRACHRHSRRSPTSR